MRAKTPARDPYAGSWRISAARAWDPIEGCWTDDWVDREDLSFAIDGDVHRYENRLGHDPMYHLGYTARYDAPEWVPYLVLHREGSGTESLEQAPLSSAWQEEQPFAFVRLVRVDRHNHYRLSRNPDGSPHYVMQRTMAEDEKSFTARFLFDGEDFVRLVRVFERR